MEITVALPEDIAQRPDPAREALEALAIEGYRSGALSAYQVQRLLGLETRFQLDGFLKAHNVWEHSYGLEEFEQDRRTLDQLGKARRAEIEPRR
jgi:predicted HTH domain antitoxin